MKKLSEVCKITGVTRRTLQMYEKKGLVIPTDTTEAGYWLYDDAAVHKIMFIQIFIEAGYSRTEIKTIFDKGDSAVIDELTQLVDRLEERKRRIDGMLFTVKTVRSSADLPDAVSRALLKMDTLGLFNKDGFRTVLNESIESASDHIEELEEAGDDFEKYAKLGYYIMAISSFVGKKPSYKEAQKCMSEFYDYFISQILEIGDDVPKEKKYDRELMEEVVEYFCCDEFIGECNGGEDNPIINKKNMDYFSEVFKVFIKANSH